MQFGKTLWAVLVFCLCSAPLFSQNLFFEKVNEEDRETSLAWMVDVNQVRENYKRELSRFTDVFFNDVFKMLVGEKDLLNNMLGILQLAQVNNEYLRMLRNMVYARYGLIFKSDDLVTYFNKIDWYKPEHQSVDGKLTETDKYNVRIIQAFENRNEGLRNVDWGGDGERVGVWHRGCAVASSYSDRFVIYPNNKMEYYAADDLDLQILRGMTGTYSIKGNVLTFSVNEVMYNKLLNFGVQPHPNHHAWESSVINKIRLEKPLVYKFPVSAITTSFEYREDGVGVVTIGDDSFCRIHKDPNMKH